MTGAKKILSTADYQMLATLRFTLRKFSDFSTSAAQEEGLPSQQHQALLAIKGHAGSEAMTIGLLASRLLIAPHTATELVNRLTRSGLVARKVDSADKRRQFLELTGKAEEIMLRLTSTHMTEIKEMAPELILLLQKLQDS
ncbi:MarR family winged helix-turn-helix transcriptional regulator [Rhizobium leguminosarum]|uniref:MarR family winged helix-turn-helix transcriptional regulator n=1 Tax=Rhizobium leguminosarum TaxID=384 RepID=UPI001C951394|nr:helix-turn-helix domain-containing protein [Rhizobium leguminosarum]MBY5466403.1 MarR family transcriptional regulator [Rhizobium leguminosarum]MBY5529392.1 MarR family transcriptional regulator [Rhizobium leguminosarum]